MLVSRSTSRFLKMVSIALAVVLISGCSRLRDPYMVDALINGTSAVDPEDQPDYKDVDDTDQHVPQPINLATYKIPLYEDEKDADPKIGSVVEIANWSKDGRNGAMDFLLMRSDIICEKHTAAIISGTAATNFVLAEITTVLSGLGAIFTPESTIRALSGAASITNATRAQYNEAVLQNMLNTTVVSAIWETRAKLLSNLEAKRSYELKEYSGYQMLDDVVKFHQACSLYSGLVALKDAAQNIRPSTAEIGQRLKTLETRLKEVNAQIVAAKEDPTLMSSFENSRNIIAAEYARLIQMQGIARP